MIQATSTLASETKLFWAIASATRASGAVDVGADHADDLDVIRLYTKSPTLKGRISVLLAAPTADRAQTDEAPCESSA